MANRFDKPRKVAAEDLRFGDVIPCPVKSPGFEDRMTVKSVKPKGDGSGVLFVHSCEYGMPFVFREGQEVLVL